MVIPREGVLQPALAMASAFVVFIAAARGASAHCHETSAAKCYIDTMSPRVLSGYEVDGDPDTPMTREFCAQVSSVETPRPRHLTALAHGPTLSSLFPHQHLRSAISAKHVSHESAKALTRSPSHLWQSLS
jgi:hypothetical protein